MTSSTPAWLRHSIVAQSKIAKSCEIYDNAYGGNQDENFVSDRVRIQVSKHDEIGYYHLNLARNAVDAPMERTQVSGIVCAEDRPRTLLEEFWKDNALQFESTVAHEKAYQYGSSVILALPDDDGIMKAYVHSPKDVTVFYEPNRPTVKSHAIHSYIQQGTDEDTNLFSEKEQPYFYVVIVYTPDSIQRWRSTTALPPSVSGELPSINYNTLDLTMVEELDNPVPGVIPAFHFRTSRDALGKSRLADASGVQVAVNDTMTAMMATVKRAGWGQRWITTEKTPSGADNFSDSNDATGTDDLDENVYEEGPSTMMHFAGQNVKVGNFAASQSSNFLTVLDSLAGWMSKITDTPAHYFTLGADAPSGESYRQGEKPLVAVVDYCKSLFEATWEELFLYVLEWLGTTAEATVAWKALSIDDADYWDNSAKKVDLGMPKKVAFVQSGIDQETVNAWFDDAPDTDPNIPPKEVTPPPVINVVNSNGNVPPSMDKVAT